MILDKNIEIFVIHIIFLRLETKKIIYQSCKA